MWWLPLFMSVAHAEVPLPSYREELVVAAWLEIDALITDACQWPEGTAGIGVPLACSEKRLDKAIQVAQDFVDHVTPDGRIHYLMGLAARHAGRLEQTERSLRTAVELSPDRKEAWLELGEMRMQRKAYDEAREAFERVAELLPEGPGAWVGWFQLAQLDAHQRRPDLFEQHIRRALRHGFSFRTIEGQPAWQAFYADPVMHDVLDRLVSYYADPEVVESLKTQPSP
jgi:cytochrome c-type biogenesis protein CcmH/NrfG